MVEEPDQPEGADPPGEPSADDPRTDPPDPPAGPGGKVATPEPGAKAERRRTQYREVLSQAPPLKPSRDRGEPS